MRLNLCTLLDSDYLARCIAMYRSLAKNCQNFHLYIFTFDDVSTSVLKNLGLPSTTIISNEEFEDEQLLAVKSGRSRAEYYWTCTPFVIKYSIEKFNLSECTYIDADLFFFASPEVLLDELKDKSILITAHNYGPGHDKALIYGKYCVQFNTFKNNPEGMLALNWWRDRCIEWCYVRLEDGKFGDQKYLDDWTEKFTGVHVLQNPGGGVAPWNDNKYAFFRKNGEVWIKEYGASDEFPLIFYHFHRTNIYKISGKIKIKSHYLFVNKNRELRKEVYEKYEKAISKSILILKKMGHQPKFDSTFDYIFKSLQEILPSWIKKPVKKLIRVLK